jgi:hypothetical protein
MLCSKYRKIPDKERLEVERKLTRWKVSEETFHVLKPLDEGEPTLRKVQRLYSVVLLFKNWK